MAARGKCIIGGEVVDPSELIIVTKHDCTSQGGEWVPNPEPPGGVCFVKNILTKALAKNIHHLGTISEDEVLRFRENLDSQPVTHRYFFSSRTSSSSRDELTTTLGESILELGPTYKIAVDFRDQILLETLVGNYFLDIYYANLETLQQITSDNLILTASFIDTWLTILPFVQGILEANGVGDWHGRTDYLDQVFTQAIHQLVIDLIFQFRAYKPTEGIEVYNKLFDELEKELTKYIGLNPREVLKLIQRSTL